MNALRFDRIRHLLSPDQLREKVVVQVGIGSGGSVVNDHLVMNGVRRWVLFDPDLYDEVNLVKHPRTRAQLGQPKARNQEEWILDRNPDAEVEVHTEDATTSSSFRNAVANADLVLACVDSREVRSFINEVAVTERRPCVTASVFRQGYGGEAYSYVPQVFGCFDCMARAADEQGWNIDESIEPSQEEEDAIYGLNLRDFRASGLSMDIQTVAILQARLALDYLLFDEERKFPPLPGNWAIVYNRPLPTIEGSGFQKTVHLKLRPRRDCRCAGPSDK